MQTILWLAFAVIVGFSTFQLITGNKPPSKAPPAATRLSPDEITYLMLQGERLESEKKTDEAIKTYHQIIKRTRATPTPIFTLPI